MILFRMISGRHPLLPPGDERLLEGIRGLTAGARWPRSATRRRACARTRTCCFSQSGVAWARSTNSPLVVAARSIRASRTSAPDAHGQVCSHVLGEITQLEFLDLAGGGFRDLGEDHVARAFVGGEIVAAPG